MYEQRPALLRRAFERGRETFADELAAFRQANRWVETYGLYMALKAHFDMQPWTEWPEELFQKDRKAYVMNFNRMRKMGYKKTWLIHELFMGNSRKARLKRSVYLCYKWDLIVNFV